VGGVVNNNYNKGANNMDGYAVLSISLRKKNCITISEEVAVLWR
jgi:hypothetical protein